MRGGEDASLEVRRIARSVFKCVVSATDFQDLMTRIRSEGIHIRPALQKDDVFGGLRFTTDKASTLASHIGLSRAQLEARGLQYERNRDLECAKALVCEHTKAHGDLNEVKARHKSIPLQRGVDGLTWAQRQMKDTILHEYRASTDIWDLGARLEAHGIEMEVNLNVKEKLANLPRFKWMGESLRGSRIGLGTRDLSPQYRSLEPRGVGRPGASKHVVVTELPVPEIGEGLADGVEQVVREINATSGAVKYKDLLSMRSSRDIWTTTPVDLIYERLCETIPQEKIEEVLGSLSKVEKHASLRWMARGVTPERMAAVNEAKFEYLQRIPRRKPDENPSPTL